MTDEAVPLYNQKMEYMEGGFGASAPLGPAVETPTPVAAPAAPIPLLLGPDNTVTTCPHCKCSVKTTVRYTTTTRTHRIAVLCFWFCFCCCLPYCMTSTRNTDHYCPSCLKYLGTYKK